MMKIFNNYKKLATSAIFLLAVGVAFGMKIEDEKSKTMTYEGVVEDLKNGEWSSGKINNVLDSDISNQLKIKLLNKFDTNGDSALIASIRRLDNNSVGKLLNWGCSADIPDQKGTLPITWAIIAKDLGIFQAVSKASREYNANWKARENWKNMKADGINLLEYAISCGSPQEIVEELARKYDYDFSGFSLALMSTKWGLYQNFIKKWQPMDSECRSPFDALTCLRFANSSLASQNLPELEKLDKEVKDARDFKKLPFLLASRQLEKERRIAFSLLADFIPLKQRLKLQMPEVWNVCIHKCFYKRADFNIISTGSAFAETALLIVLKHLKTLKINDSGLQDTLILSDGMDEEGLKNANNIIQSWYNDSEKKQTLIMVKYFDVGTHHAICVGLFKKNDKKYVGIYNRGKACLLLPKKGGFFQTVYFREIKDGEFDAIVKSLCTQRIPIDQFYTKLLPDTGNLFMSACIPLQTTSNCGWKAIWGALLFNILDKEVNFDENALQKAYLESEKITLDVALQHVKEQGALLEDLKETDCEKQAAYQFLKKLYDYGNHLEYYKDRMFQAMRLHSNLVLLKIHKDADSETRGKFLKAIDNDVTAINQFFLEETLWSQEGSYLMDYIKPAFDDVKGAMLYVINEPVFYGVKDVVLYAIDVSFFGPNFLTSPLLKDAVNLLSKIKDDKQAANVATKLNELISYL
jgi:hypothetical protein